MAGIALAAAGVVSASAPATEQGRFTLRGTVTRTIDGDTLAVRIANGRTARVRLVGVDTPEAGQCFAREATAQTRALALRRRVTLVGDRQQPTRDRFRRLLAYVTLPGGRDLGLALLQGGFAEVFEGRFDRLPRYAVARRDARDAHRGQWGRCIPLADLTVTVTDAPDPVTVGQQLTYTIAMRNLGPRSAEVPHLDLTFVQQPGPLVSATAPSGWSCGADETDETSLSYYCSSPDSSALEANASVTFQLTFVPFQPGLLNARAFASSPIEDANERNSIVDVSTTVIAGVPPPPPPPPQGNCHPSYPDVCIPPPPPDLDCGDIPYRRFRVIYTVPDPDPHQFDGNRDGIGCET